MRGLYHDSRGEYVREVLPTLTERVLAPALIRLETAPAAWQDVYSPLDMARDALTVGMVRGIPNWTLWEAFQVNRQMIIGPDGELPGTVGRGWLERWGRPVDPATAARMSRVPMTPALALELQQLAGRWTGSVRARLTARARELGYRLILPEGLPAALAALSRVSDAVIDILIETGIAILESVLLQGRLPDDRPLESMSAAGLARWATAGAWSVQFELDAAGPEPLEGEVGHVATVAEALQAWLLDRGVALYQTSDRPPADVSIALDAWGVMSDAAREAEVERQRDRHLANVLHFNRIMFPGTFVAGDVGALDPNNQTPDEPAKKGSVLPWVFGGAALVGGAYLLKKQGA